MDQSKQLQGKPFNPFKDNPEEELQKRLKHGKRLTREEFSQRVKEIKTTQLRNQQKSKD